jgi:hypothetical protein
MAKKKQIQTNGKVETQQITSLEQLWGVNDLSRYGTTDEDTYRQKLNEFNKSDLEAHARQIGVTIPEGVERLKGNLIRQFRVYVSSLKNPPPPLSKGPMKMTPEIEKILAEGK